MTDKEQWPPASNKTPEMEKALDEIAKSLYGRGRNEGVCVTCGSPKIAPEDFRDMLSQKEFGISGMCQDCQDSVFQVED
jgi:hypothetical protein